MAYTGSINVLIVNHYFASEKSRIDHLGMLDDLKQAIRARGFSGSVALVEYLNDVEKEKTGAIAVEHMAERNWKGVLDTFEVAIENFEHTVVIFGAQ